jgi:hypothetical protein
MAQVQAALNNYLTNVLGIVQYDVINALNNQGLTSIDDFISLTEDDIGDVCTIARKPGGMIPNPALLRRAPIAGLPPTIPNPGVLIGHLHEKRLKMLRYYMHHLHRIQRTFDPNHATLAVITDIYKLKEAEDDDDDVDLPEKLTTVEKVRVVLENIDNYLIRKRGSSFVPLAYVTRENLAAPDIADDDGFGIPSHIAEMVRRAPHVGIHYENDNRMVWDLVRHIAHDGPGWSWVQGFQKTRDGRAAYLSIKAHYLGESYTARLRAKADMTMENTFYDGKSRSFTFERYCEVLQGAFTDIFSTGEEVSQARKVRILLNGITDSRLQHAKSQVLATPALKETFENAVNYMAQFLDEKRSYSTNRGTQRNISFTQTSQDRSHGKSGTGRGHSRGRGHSASGRGGRGRGGGGRGYNNKANEVTDKYYTPEEWKQLTSEQQARVRELRSNRDKRRGVQVVESRNVKQKSDDISAITNSTAGAAVPTVSTATASIGAVTTNRSRHF